MTIPTDDYEPDRKRQTYRDTGTDIIPQFHTALTDPNSVLRAET